MNESRERARLLLTKAREDALMMRELLRIPQVPRWGGAFHAQQAAEKAIKAVLAAHGISFPLTHDLQALLTHLRVRAIPGPPGETQIPRLTPYATVFRYEALFKEEASPELGAQEMENLVAGVLDWAAGHVSPLMGPSP